MTAGETEVGARECGYGYNRMKHLRKVGEEGSEGERQVCVCSERIGAEQRGCQGEGK